ncbi:hypothetical protein D9Q98_005870 [Chlorella vulgaris]|uniref:Uncharacterized protein n=1 Tax=Chlorella vulgaris TaxID=3077 RepID=A0A9D4Z101_CHLVU|nr:hypothetical protein D9Q98_005870 [Chlorella vulgaris]
MLLTPSLTRTPANAKRSAAAWGCTRSKLTGLVVQRAARPAPYNLLCTCAGQLPNADIMYDDTLARWAKLTVTSVAFAAFEKVRLRLLGNASLCHCGRAAAG